MALSISTLEKVIITAQALAADGSQVDFTSSPVFSVADPSIGTLVALDPSDPQPPAGQVSMWLVSGSAGSSVVSVSANAVLGDDTTKITGTLDFTVTAPVVLAATIAVSAGSPVKK